eukprot:3883451-Alexandrium_andersonii.AAC.1
MTDSWGSGLGGNSPWADAPESERSSVVEEAECEKDASMDADAEREDEFVVDVARDASLDVNMGMRDASPVERERCPSDDDSVDARTIGEDEEEEEESE